MKYLHLIILVSNLFAFSFFAEGVEMPVIPIELRNKEELWISTRKSYEGMEGRQTKFYWLGNDSIINGKECRIVNFRDFDGLTYGQGAFYVEDKTYFYNSDINEKNEHDFVKIMDFNVNPGEIIPGGGVGDYKVQSLELINVNESALTLVKLESELSPNGFWLEKIGASSEACTYESFNPYIGAGNVDVALFWAYYQQGKCIFSIDDFAEYGEILIPEDMPYSKIKIGNLFYALHSDPKTAAVWNEEFDTSSNYRDLPKTVIIEPSVEYADDTYLVTSIGYKALSGCTGLEQIEIPATVLTIDYGAFECNSLHTIIFKGYPELVSDSFSGSTNINAIYVDAQEPPKDNSSDKAFNPITYEMAILYVPKEYIESFQESPFWSNFKNIKAFDFTNGVGDNVLASDSISDGKMFDIFGREILQPAKGQIYIKNGKKIIGD